jgi:PAS domain S-box-containing protein
MVLSREVTARIKEVLEKHPEGISITALVKSVEVNRNTAGRYLENLLLSGQVEMRRFGMAKMYSLTKRLPVSSVLSISSELVLQLDTGQRVFYANDPLLSFIAVPAKDLFGKNIEFTPFSIVFEEVFPDLLDRIRRGLRGEEWHGELSRPVRGKYFLCRIAPTVTSEGKKGVSVLLEDISDQKRDEERIRKSEARLRSIFMASPVGIGVVAGRVLLEVNDRLCQMTGYSAGELIGRSVRMLYPSEEEFDKVGSLLYNQVQQSGSGAVEIQWARKDGRIIDILLSSTPLDPANISGGITFTALDITERNLASQALRESEDRYRTLAEASRDFIFVIGRDDRVEYVNSYAAASLGLSADQVIGKKRSSLFSQEEGQRQAQGLRKVFETGKAGRNEGAMEISGVLHWFDHYLMPITDAHGTVTSVLGVSRDINDRKRVETALRESEDRYRKLVEISPDAVILHRDGKIIYVNPALVRLMGAKSADDLLGSDVLDFIQPAFRDTVRHNIEKDLSGETTPPTELQMLRADGTPVVVAGRGVGTSIGGKPAVLVAINDITERHQAEIALKKSEERYRSVFENTGAATAIIEENTLVSLMNTEFERISGYTKQEIEKKKSWADFVVKEDLERMLAWHYRRRESGDAPHQYEAGVIKKNGEIRRALITVGLIPGTSQTVVSLIDITHRQEAEDALRASEQLYRFIADNSLDIITRQTPECICTYVSPAVTPLLGYKVMDVLGKSVLSLVHPDDLPMIQRHLVSILQDNTSQITTTFRMRHKDGHYFWFESMTKIIRDEKTGRIREFLSVSRDITARMQRGKESNQGQG